MSDLIDRKAAIDVIDKIFPADPMRNDYTQGITCGAALAKEYIKQLPLAEPKRGRWDVEHGVFMYDDIYGDIYRCSVCGYKERNPEGFNYCPNCGAKMSEIPTDSESEDKE